MKVTYGWAACAAPLLLLVSWSPAQDSGKPPKDDKQVVDVVAYIRTLAK